MLLWRNEADCDADRGSASEPAQQTAAAATTTRPLLGHPLVFLPQTLFPLKFNVLFSLCPARTHIRWQRTLSLISVFDFRPFYSKNVNESSDGNGSGSAQQKDKWIFMHTHTQTKNARALPTRSGNNNRERCGNGTWERAPSHSLLHCEWTVEFIEAVWNVFVSATKWTIWAISTNSSNSTVVFNWGKHTLTQRYTYTHTHAHARTPWANKIQICSVHRKL